jgi:hypothetical protein
MKTYKYENYTYTIMQKHNGTYSISIDDENGTPVFDDDNFSSLAAAKECSKTMIDDLQFRKGE